MNMSPGEKNEQMALCLERSGGALHDAEFLLQNGRLEAAVNRIYYSVFYRISALAIKHGFHASKHQQLIGWFNKTFVRDGTIDTAIGAVVVRAFEKRMEGDYDYASSFQRDDVSTLIAEVRNAFVPLDKIIKDA